MEMEMKRLKRERERQQTLASDNRRLEEMNKYA